MDVEIKIQNIRCWGAGEQDYHDFEWGRPTTSDDKLFEKMTLESFQSGLSWLTILRKRASFVEAFAEFNVEKVARFDDSDVDRLLLNSVAFQLIFGSGSLNLKKNMREKVNQDKFILA